MNISKELNGEETGYKSDSYVNGAELFTTVNSLIAQHKYGDYCGMFIALNGTTALNYPKNGHFFIEYIADKEITGGVMITATELNHPEKIYRTNTNENSAWLVPWSTYVPISTPQSVSITVDTTKVTSGSIEVVRCGKIVQVYFRNVKFAANGNNQVIASGLPRTVLQQAIVFSNESISKDDSVWIPDNSTALYANIHSYNVGHYNGMVYITYED